MADSAGGSGGGSGDVPAADGSEPAEITRTGMPTQSHRTVVGTFPPSRPPVAQHRLRVGRLFTFWALAGGLGALAGALWWKLVELPYYTINDAGGATTTERGLSNFIAGDAWFCAIGAVVGLMLGVATWILFRDTGWTAVPIVLVAALGAALVCWAVGHYLGPDDFTTRLAAAPPGEQVPIELTLRTRISLVAWAFAATIPVLLGSSLGHDHEEPRPLFRRRES